MKTPEEMRKLSDDIDLGPEGSEPATRDIIAWAVAHNWSITAELAERLDRIAEADLEIAHGAKVILDALKLSRKQFLAGKKVVLESLDEIIRRLPDPDFDSQDRPHRREGWTVERVAARMAEIQEHPERAIGLGRAMFEREELLRPLIGALAEAGHPIESFSPDFVENSPLADAPPLKGEDKDPAPMDHREDAAPYLSPVMPPAGKKPLINVKICSVCATNPAVLGFDVCFICHPRPRKPAPPREHAEEVFGRGGGPEKKMSPAMEHLTGHALKAALQSDKMQETIAGLKAKPPTAEEEEAYLARATAAMLGIGFPPDRAEQLARDGLQASKDFASFVPNNPGAPITKEERMGGGPTPISELEKMRADPEKPKLCKVCATNPAVLGFQLCRTCASPVSLSPTMEGLGEHAPEPNPREVHIPIPEGLKVKVCRGPQDDADPKPGEPDVGLAVLRLHASVNIIRSLFGTSSGGVLRALHKAAAQISEALRVLKPEEKP